MISEEVIDDTVISDISGKIPETDVSPILTATNTPVSTYTPTPTYTPAPTCTLTATPTPGIDSEPPVITGVQAITVNFEETVAYKRELRSPIIPERT